MTKLREHTSIRITFPFIVGAALLGAMPGAHGETAKQSKAVEVSETTSDRPKTLFDLFKKKQADEGAEAGKTAEKKPLFGKPSKSDKDSTKLERETGTAFGNSGLEALLKQKTFSYNGKTINPANYAAFYKANKNKPLWTEKSGFFGIKKDISPEGKKLLAALRDAKNDGLNPSDYYSPMPGSLKQVKGAELAQIELYLTASLVDFARDLYIGKIDPTQLADEIVPAKKTFDANAILQIAAKQGINAALQRARPSHPQYQALRTLMGRTLDPNKRAQIAVNMERWRWLPEDLGHNHILVNQPAFKVYIYNGNSIIDERNVVVGKPEFKSPIFSDTMEYVEFNPQWNIPSSIAVNEFLPKLVANKSYLHKLGYTVYEGFDENSKEIDSRKVNWSKVEANQDKFPYRFVQGEGGDNALGEVKFLFPNKFNVYLHDTPSKKLFKQPSRAFSHGCIRVQDPLDFAEKIFGLAGGIAPQKIRDTVATRERKQVNLTNKLPVHLTYFTVWVENGQPNFYDDVYGRDSVLRPMIN